MGLEMSEPEKQPASAQPSEYPEQAAQLSLQAHELTEPALLRSSPPLSSPTVPGGGPALRAVEGEETKEEEEQKKEERGGGTAPGKGARARGCGFEVVGIVPCPRGLVGKEITWVNKSFYLDKYFKA